MKIKIKNFVFAGFAAAMFAGSAMAAGDTVVTSKAYVDSKLAAKANTADLAAVATSGDYGDLINKPTIPTVPTNVGAFTNDAGYITSAQVPAQVNADWDATSGAAQILNKPTIPTVPTNVSAFTNDAGYATTSQLPTIDTELSPVSTNPVQNKVVTSAIATANTNIQNLQRDKQNNIDANNKLSYQYVDGLATVAHSGDYNDLSNKPTIPTAVSDLTNDANYITSADVPAQVNADWTATSGAAQILNKPTLAAVATSGNASDLTQDATHRLVTDTEKATWNAKQDAIGDLSTIRSGAAAGATAVQPNDLAAVATSGSYNDLSNKPTIPAAQVQSDWNATTGMGAILNKPTLSAVATSGDYDDLSNKPTIPTVPTNVSSFTNDAGYLTPTTAAEDFQEKSGVDYAVGTSAGGWTSIAKPSTCNADNPCAWVNNTWYRIAQAGD